MMCAKDRLLLLVIEQWVDIFVPLPLYMNSFCIGCVRDSIVVWYGMHKMCTLL